MYPVPFFKPIFRILYDGLTLIEKEGHFDQHATREKELYSFLILLIGMLIAVSVFSSFVVLSSYSSLEKQYVFKDLDQTIQMINDDENTLSVIVSDWGSRDDTYNFVKDDNSDYLTDNLIPGTFEKLRLNLIIIVNNQGGIIYQGAYDLKNNTMFPVPDSILNQITPGSPLLNMSDPQKATTGLYFPTVSPDSRIPSDRLFEFFRNPAGVVIMGRDLNANEVRYLAGTYPANPGSYTCDRSRFFRRPAYEPGRTAGRESFSLSCRQYKPSRGLCSHQGYLWERCSGRQFLRAPEYLPDRAHYHPNFIYIILATGLVFGLVFVVIFNRILISRLGALNQQVQSIGHNHAIKKRINIGGDDEFSGLAGEINRMLDTIEKTQQGLQASQTRFRELAELMPQTIFEIDLEGKILYINTAGADVFGVTKQKIADGTDIRDYVLPDVHRADDAGSCKRYGRRKIPRRDVWPEKRRWQYHEGPGIDLSHKKAGNHCRVPWSRRRYHRSDPAQRAARGEHKTPCGILQASPVGVFRLDRQGHVIFVNETFSKITGSHHQLYWENTGQIFSNPRTNSACSETLVPQSRRER